MKRAAMTRVPRERGVVVEISGTRIQAVSVGDLYKQALRLLVDKHKPDLVRLTPYKTSPRRFLLANKPVHPNGNSFVVPVDYHGFYMEAHKDYHNAINHLRAFVQKLGLSLNNAG